MISKAINTSCEFIDSQSNRFAESYAIPFVKGAYEKARPITAKVVGYFSKPLGERVFRQWHDPFSSESVLKVTKHVEAFSGLIARSEVTNRPYLQFLDRSLTSCSQHLYASVKEVNYLLNLPDKLRDYASKFTVDRFMLQVSEYSGKLFVVVSKIILIAKYTVLALIDLIIKVVDCTIQFFTFTKKIAVLGYLRDIIHAAKGEVHDKFVDIAKRTITNRENHIRKQITAKITNTVTDYIVSALTRGTIKTAIGGALYYTAATLAQSTLDASPSVARLAGTAVAAGVVWQTTVKPFLDSYYKTYNPNFKTDSTQLKSFLKEHSLSNFYVPLKMLKEFLTISE